MGFRSISYLAVPSHQIRSHRPHWSSALATVKRETQAWTGRELSILARTQLYDVFLVSKLICVMQVLSCARRTVQAFHRVLAILSYDVPSGSPCSGITFSFRESLVSWAWCIRLSIRSSRVSSFFKMADHPSLRFSIPNNLSADLPFYLRFPSRISQATLGLS